jgi:hypothetical protein
VFTARRDRAINTNFFRSADVSQEVLPFMQYFFGKSLIGSVATLLATTCLGFAAGSSHKSPERGTAVTFIHTTKLYNGDTLPAGTYWMEVPETFHAPAVTFSQNGKVRATIGALVILHEKKNEETEIDSVIQGEAQVLTAIHPAGWEEELIFGSAGQDASPSVTP